MVVAPPESIELDHPDRVVLHRVRPSDAEAVAQCVAESRDHLIPWMPWAGSDDSIDPRFQRTRLTLLHEAWNRGEEFSFVLVHPPEARVLGTCGLMTRRGPGSLEIGYFTHAAVGGRGYGRALAQALTAVGSTIDGIDRVYICCDEANVRSAAIPRALGYELESIVDDGIQAPGESGRAMIWVKRC
jgi:RimJ/RimL family protein N-acetyltransferase